MVNPADCPAESQLPLLKEEPRVHPPPPPIQHRKSDGPEQYPATVDPPQALVCLHVPVPCGVEHGLFVQQRISEDPGHSPDVTVPEQHPEPMETQTPSTPPTLHYTYRQQ